MKFRSTNSAIKVVSKYLNDLRDYCEIDIEDITFGSAIFDGAEEKVHDALRFLKESFNYQWEDPLDYIL